MSSLFTSILFISIICVIVGLINPKVVIRWGNDNEKKRSKVLLYYGLVMVMSFIIAVATSPSTEEK